MRVLQYSILAEEPPGSGLMRHPDLEVSGLHARSVDCGDFGRSRPDPRDYDGRYDLHLLPVFPHRPYPYARFAYGLGTVLRKVRPEVLFIVGEPSELGVAQVVRAACRHVPECRILLHSFENVARTWRGFPRALRGRAERATLLGLDMVRAVSEGVRDVLEAQGYPADRIRVWHPGIDTSRFSPMDAGELRAELAGEDRLLVGYVGRLVPEKGIDLLLRAVSELGDEVAVCLLGSGREEARLRALADDLPGLEVRWQPHVPRDEVARYLNAFDVLVLPSRSIPTWQEQFGRVLVEAMACGTPVVGSSSGAIPEVIGDAGLVFPEGDHAALAEVLARLHDDEELRRELGRRGLARARDHFSPEKDLQRLVELFREALARPPLRRQ